ncbi:carboxymuconolactone decarboxylase family protein [Nakamurella aerolata]|uniref:Carboxymuconolactone decarboxylase family protein n=1 Tax=Nakamurella aerolata TaxID=1656892 RepID=A0A849ABX3_9ACTN|nr:carboxymuconolactone decarboxylase family protein [Nakamurella aerolata]NNG37427.1 carboxymuconolactone decarboxylase family protein [Nakamurella aerolata]
MSNPRIPAAKVTGLYGRVVSIVSRRLLGRVPEPLGIYFHNRKVLGSYLSISQKSQRWNACDAGLKSYAHMAVAAQLGCSWCLDFGYFEAFNKNLNLDKAREVPRWRESTVFTELERDVLSYAEAMTLSPPQVDEALSARLLGALGAPALVELTALIALANFYARSNVAFGIESEGYADACQLRPLAAAPQAAGVPS